MPGEGDVLINFVGKFDELQPAEDALDSIVKKEGDVGEAWKKTTDIIASGTKANTESSNKLAKSIEAMAVAAKSMDKVVVAGAYKEYLKQIQTQMGLTNKELINYIQNARQSAQQKVLAVGTDQELDELALSIQVMNDELTKLVAAEDGVETKTQSLKSQLRQAKEELVAMAEAGQQGTPAFQALQNKAGELDDQIRDLNATIKNVGSDTKNIEGLVGIATGVAGGFAVAQGTAALFGSESEEVQKALLKVNAAMSILQGLQQIENVLQKESAATLLLKSIFLRQTTVATTENTLATEANVVANTEQAVAVTAVTVAEGEQVVATGAATEAQIALNTAMELNPIALVIAGIVALTAAVAYFASNNNNAAKELANLNDALQQSTLYLEGDIKALEHQTAVQLANAKERGASVTELASLEGNASLARLKAIDAARVAAAKAYNEAKADDEESIKAKQKLYDRIFQLQQQYQDESNAIKVKGIEFQTLLNQQEFNSFVALQQAKVAATIAGTDNERTAQIAALRAIAAEREKSADFIALTEGEKTLKRVEDERQIQALQLQNYQHYLKGRADAQEASIALAKLALIKNETDTIGSLNRITALQIEAERKKQKEALANPTLNSGEQEKIINETNLRIAELQKQQQQQLLDIEKAGINAKLLLSEKGSIDEYNNRISLLLKEQEIELSVVELSAEKRAEILAKYQKQREDLERSFTAAQLQNEISRESALLEQYNISESEKLAITLKRLDTQRELEILQAENNAAKIAEINAKYDKQIIESKKAAIQAILDDNLKTFDAFSGDSKLVNEKILSSDKSTFEQKKAASAALLKNELIRIDLQASAERKLLNDGVINQAQYNVAIEELNNKRKEATIKSEEEVTAATLVEIEKRTAKIQFVFGLLQKSLQDTLGKTGLTVGLTELENFGVKAQDVFAKIKAGIITTAEGTKELIQAGISGLEAVTTQIFADNAAARQQSLQDALNALEAEKNKEVENKNLTEEQKASIEKRFKDKEKQEKLRAFEADKQAKKQQALINGFLSFTAALPNFFLAGASLAAALIEVAAIENIKAPKFKHGKVDIQGPGTSTSDSISAWISKGESVINANATAKHKDVLTAINENKFDEYLSRQIGSFIYPNVPDHLEPASKQPQIDYDKLAMAVAREMRGVIPAPKSMHVTVDENGVKVLAHEGSSQIESKNKRYSMT